MKRLRTAALVLALVSPGLARAQPYTPTFDALVLAGGLSQTMAIAMASNTSNDAAHSGLFLNQSFTGISNSSPVQTKLNSITIFDSVRPVTGNLLDANVLVNYSGTTGNRTAFDATLNQTGATNDLANSFFTALSGTSVGANNNGGTGVTFATSLGHAFGGNLVSHLKAGATNWRQSASLELNNWIEVGASAAIRSFLSIAAVGGVGVQGSLIDAGIWIYSDAINPLIKTGILIGGGGINSYPIDPAGSYISDDITGTVTPTTAYGLHFVGAFTTASISVPGFSVDGTGLASAATLKVGGTGPITGFGTAIGQAPQFINWNGSGFPGLHLGSRLILDQTSPAATDFTMLQLTRTSAFTGGSGLFNSIIRSVASIGAGDATDNWGIASLMSTSGNSGGEATAGFFQTRALAGSTDFNITMISDYRDETNLGTLASGSSGGGAHEFDLEANGPDDGINALSLGGVGVRKMQHLVAVRLNGANTAQTEVSHGIWGSTQTGASGPADAHTNYGSFIGFSLNTQIRNGLDTRLAIPPAGSANPVAAVTMKSGHVIDFNGSVSSITAAPGNYLWYDSSVSRWKYSIAGVDKFSIDASGNVRAAGTVTGSTTP